MGYTSTNALGRVHFSGDIVSGGGPNRNGVSLDAVSTGNAPGVSARGDASNVDFDISAKGTGKILVGSSGTRFRHILQGNSTFLYPELALGAVGVSTVTAPGLSTGSMVFVQAPSSMSTNYDVVGAYVSGANEMTVSFRNAAASSQGTGYSTSDVLRWGAITF
jgi:hypothetical protein